MCPVLMSEQVIFDSPSIYGQWSAPIALKKALSARSQAFEAH
jgi:hypothetical protein